jgi:hypothetical protein
MRTSFESERLMMVLAQPPAGLRPVETDGGAGMFPLEVTVTARYGNGPILRIELGFEDGRPVVSSFAVEREEGGPPISASMVDELPIGSIFDEVIGRLATTGLAMFRAHNAASEGRPRVFLTPEEAEAARTSVGRRGRPVEDDQLRLVAEIVQANPYAPRPEIRDRLHVSERTASRWIKEARRRGLLEAKEGEPNE